MLKNINQDLSVPPIVFLLHMRSNNCILFQFFKFCSQLSTIYIDEFLPLNFNKERFFNTVALEGIARRFDPVVNISLIVLKLLTTGFRIKKRQNLYSLWVESVILAFSTVYFKGVIKNNRE